MRGKLLVILIAIFGGAGLLGGAAFAFGPQIQSSRFQQQLRAAEERWAGRGFSEYRLVLQDDSGRCRQEVLVAGERVQRRLSNSCRIPPRTINSIFRLIEGTPPSRYTCVEHRCACDTVVSVETDYDSELGYPRSVRFSWSVRASWHRLDYWSYALSHGALPSCRDTKFSRAIHVIALEPIK